MFSWCKVYFANHYFAGFSLNSNKFELKKKRVVDIYLETQSVLSFRV